MRGNSQCDSINALSISESRILVNTDNSILLMEFEQVQYDYASSAFLSTQETQSRAEEELGMLASAKHKPRKSYSSIRASRSELVATPNVKLLFSSSERKVMPAVMLDHSARPISGRNLKDAQLVHHVTSARSLNISKNSIGNISDLSLYKRQSVVQIMNATIQAKTSSASPLGRQSMR
jgi:hypothetical protein